MQRSSSEARHKDPEPLAFEDNKVDFSKFKTELSAVDIAKLVWTGGGVVIWPRAPIDTLSPIKTIGQGRTNLTLINPTIVQIDAATPYAGFGNGTGTVSVHFEPTAYGITSVATYIMVFHIQTVGSATFTLGGYVGSGSLPNAGTKVLNGLVTVQLVMQNVQPDQQTYGFLQETSGAAWNWFSTVIKFPDIVLEPIAA